MADTTFVPQETRLVSPWLQDVNDFVYALKGTTFDTVAAETAAGVTPVNYGYPPLDIRRYGAVADDSTNCDAALLAAIRTACCWFGTGSLYAASIYIPPGTFLVTTNNLFGQVDFTTLPTGYDTLYCFGVRGNGMSSRLHWKPTGSSAAYLYDNGVSGGADNRLVWPIFENFSCHMDVTGLSSGGTVNGFRVYGDLGANGVTQGFKFHNCKFAAVDNVDTLINATNVAKTGTFFETIGTVNASEMVMSSCVVRGLWTLFRVGENLNGVNHNLFATDADIMFGDVVNIAGGSSFNWRGGSVTMWSESAAWFVNMSVTTDGYFGTHIFDGVRVECNASKVTGAYYSGVFNLDTNAVGGSPASFKATVNFNGCNFYPITGSARDTITVDAATNMTVNFTGCAIAPTHKMNALNTLAALQASTVGPFTRVNFSNGEAVLPANVTFADATSVVHVSAKGCVNTLDYDLTAAGRFENRAGSSIPLKTAFIWGGAWPDTGANDTMTITLPARALIKRVAFSKAANGGAATASYQLAIQDAEGTVHASSTIANQNVLHAANVDDLLLFCSTANKQVINVVATAGHLGSAQTVAMGAGDYAIVDYY